MIEWSPTQAAETLTLTLRLCFRKPRSKKCKQAVEIGAHQCPQTLSANKHPWTSKLIAEIYVRVCKSYSKLRLSPPPTDSPARLLTIHHLNQFISDQAAQHKYWFLCYEAVHLHRHTLALILGLWLCIIKLTKTSPSASHCWKSGAATKLPHIWTCLCLITCKFRLCYFVLSVFEPADINLCFYR